jgi:N-acetylmuramoyl-L-alanine amidase
VLIALQKRFTLHSSKIQRAGFAVLKSLDVPSLLIRNGLHLESGRGRLRLLDPRHQERLAHAIFDGIRGPCPEPGPLAEPGQAQSRRGGKY